VLQCVAMCCSALQCVAVCCSVSKEILRAALSDLVVVSSVFQYAAVYFSVLQRVAACCSVFRVNIKFCESVYKTDTHIHTPRTTQKKNLRMGLASVFQFQFQFFTLNLNNSDRPKSRGVDCDRAHLD